MAVKTWKPLPLDMTIVEILEKKGPLTDMELYDLVREKHEDVGFGVLNRTLMKMEIGGKVYVSTLTKGKRRVQLTEHKEGR